MRYDIVVARYKENIDWLKQVDVDCNIIIYNKFYDEQIKLENVGRESHTYLHHIVENYENLADVTFFTQADPFDHSPNFLNHVKQIVTERQSYGFKGLTKPPVHGHAESLRCDLDGNPHHGGLNLKYGTDTIFKDFNIFTIEFNPGAIFLASKENILKREKQFYINCLNLCINTEWKDRSGTLAAPYFFERMWKTIFDTNII
jgi:hypothetical protein